ncbi:MAG: 16S rRNA (guanine(527)-N(7))-methyltransferase RsmG [Chromatocurvus sp.]
MGGRCEAETLLAGCDQLGVPLPAGAASRLSRYLDLLEKWNRAYNLTAVRSRADMVDRHILDSLAILPHLQGRRFLDAGSGAGLPGIPLAICLPERDFVLLDSNGKKTRFLFQARLALELANVEVVDARVEAYRPQQPFDGVLSRAFASLSDMVTLCAHLTSDGARLYAMKGAGPGGETETLREAGLQVTTTILAVPGLDEQRSLVTIYPRRPAQ